MKNKERYYRVKPSKDNHYLNGDCLIGGELKTVVEVGILASKKPIKPDVYFDIVDEYPSNIYWFFGARFSENYPYEV